MRKMQPRNIDEDAQCRRRKDAIHSAVVSSLMMLLPAIGMLLLLGYYAVGGFWGTVLRILSVLELGAIVPVWILLKKRLKEIEGGEEDAAAEY